MIKRDLDEEKIKNVVRRLQRKETHAKIKPYVRLGLDSLSREASPSNFDSEHVIPLLHMNAFNTTQKYEQILLLKNKMSPTQTFEVQNNFQNQQIAKIIAQQSESKAHFKQIPTLIAQSVELEEESLIIKPEYSKLFTPSQFQDSPLRFSQNIKYYQNEIKEFKIKLQISSLNSTQNTRIGSNFSTQDKSLGGNSGVLDAQASMDFAHTGKPPIPNRVHNSSLGIQQRTPIYRNTIQQQNWVFLPFIQEVRKRPNIPLIPSKSVTLIKKEIQKLGVLAKRQDSEYFNNKDLRQAIRNKRCVSKQNSSILQEIHSEKELISSPVNVYQLKIRMNPGLQQNQNDRGYKTQTLFHTRGQNMDLIQEGSNTILSQGTPMSYKQKSIGTEYLPEFDQLSQNQKTITTMPLEGNKESFVCQSNSIVNLNELSRVQIKGVPKVISPLKANFISTEDLVQQQKFKSKLDILF